MRVGGGASVSTVRVACDASAKDVTAVTDFFDTPSFFGRRVSFEREGRAWVNVAFKVQNFRIPLDRSNFGRQLT
jgi:hypothetical protein